MSSEHTHTVNTHPEQWAAIAPAPGEQLGVWCLAQGHLSHGIEGGESAVHSQSPPSIPAGARIKPAGYKPNSLTARPQLPEVEETQSAVIAACDWRFINLVCHGFE